MSISQSEVKLLLTANDQLTAKVDQVNAALGRLGVSAHTAGSAAASSGTSFGQMAGAMTLGSVAANAITGAISNIAGAMASAGGATLNLASRLEQARIGFTTMLGSVEKADQFIGQLQQKAESTAFNFPGLQQTAQSFLAMGISAQNVIPIIDDVSNALSAAGHGGDTEALQRVGASLSEIAAQGKITAEQIRELSRNGIAVLPLLAEAFGKTTAEVRKMAENGEISANMFFAAFHSEVALHYGDIQAQQAKTWAVAASNVSDVLGRLSTQTFKELTDALTQGALVLNDFLHTDRVLQWAADFKASIHDVLTALAPLGDALKAMLGVTGGGAAPTIKAATPGASQARDNWSVPPAAIKSAEDYAGKIAAGTANIHTLTAALTSLSEQQNALKNQIDDIQQTYKLRLVGLRDQQEAINASIEATKEKWAAVIEPLQKTQAQLQRLEEDTKAAFSKILDPLKTQLDGVNTKIADSKAAFEATAKPIQAQIDAITRANSALAKQRDLVVQIADLALRQKALAALGDPNLRADIASKLKALDLSDADLQRKKDLLDLDNKKGRNDKAIADVQKQIDANRRQEIGLEQQLADAANKKALIQIAGQTVLNDAQKEALSIAQKQADLDAQAKTDPLEAQLAAAKAQLQTLLDPLEAQAASLAKMIQAVSAQEAAALAPIIAAQASVSRQLQDANQALQDALKPLEAQSKAIAAQIKEVEAAERAELAPIQAKLDALQRESADLEIQKKQIADKIQAWKDEEKAIKDATAAATAHTAALDLSGGATPPGAPDPKVGVSQITPETIQAIKDTAVSITNLGKAYADLTKALGPLNTELDKLSAKFGKDSPVNGPDDAKIAAWQKFGSVVLAVITSEIDGLNTWGDIFSKFGEGMSHEIASLKLLWSGDIFGAAQEHKAAAEAFSEIPTILGQWKDRSIARLEGEPKPATVATQTWGGYVDATDTALIPLGPTIQEAIDNGAKILPDLPAAIDAQGKPMTTAAEGLGGKLGEGVNPKFDQAVQDAQLKAAGVPQAVIDQHASMLVEATTLGGNLPKGMGLGLDAGKPAVEKNIGDWILDVVKKFDPLYKLFQWFEEHWPGQKVPKAGATTGMIPTNFNPGGSGLPAGVIGMELGGTRDEMIHNAALQFGLDEETFWRQLRQESGNSLDINMTSPAGARGPGQFMPGTGNEAAGMIGVSPEQFWASAELQIQGAAAEMASYLKQFGSWANALIAYNAGPGAVGGPLYDETRDYLAKILPNGEPQGGGATRTMAFHAGGASSGMDLVSMRATLPVQADLIAGTEQLAQAQQVAAQADAAAADARARLTQIMTGGTAATSSLAGAQQAGATWAQRMAEQQAALNATLAQQVPPGRAAADAMKNLGQVLGPVERQIAAGAITANTLRGTLLQLAKSTGLADKPWADFATGAMDANAAMDELIASSAGLGPEFQAVADYEKTAGSSSNEAALRWFQAAEKYAAAKDALGAAPAVPPVPAATVNSVDAVAGNWGTVKTQVDVATESVKNYQIVVQGLDPSKINEQTTAVDADTAAVGQLSDGLHNLADFLDGHEFHVKVKVDDIPSWATPGSPTPFEMGLRGIGRAMDLLHEKRLGIRAGVAPVPFLPSGPSLLSPASRAAAFSSAGGGGGAPSPIHIENINISGVRTEDPAELARKVRDELIKTGTRNGGRVIN